MTAIEIFSELSAHMIKGLMFHSQMADYYMFLGLPKYSRCHEEHYEEESRNWRKLCRHFVKHYDKLIPETPIDSPDTIPTSWYNYSRQDVDNNTKMKAIKVGLEKWITWETETKQLYEHMFEELFTQHEIALAMFIKCYIKDVDDELAKAKQYQLNKAAFDYDMSVIIAEQ